MPWAAEWTESEPVSPTRPCFATVWNLLHDTHGKPIVCTFKGEVPNVHPQGLFCQRFEGGTWAPVGAQPLLAGDALETDMAMDSEGGLIVLGRKLETLRLYRQLPAEATP